MEDYYSMKPKDKVNESQFNKFDDILFSLDSKLNPIEGDVTKQQVYRRLSGHFVSSPAKFTKKLITIIEESLINSTLNMSDNSMINFEKMSKDLQRMCDDLENQSMPEELFFTTITSSSTDVSKIIMDDNSTQITTEKCCTELPSKLSLNKDSFTIKTPSPTITSKKVYRKTPRSIFKSEMRIMNDIIPLSPSKDNNMSFEQLEAYCERLFPNEKKDCISVQTVQDSTLLSMPHVFTICEQQLASLNSTSDDVKVISQRKKEDSVNELQMQSKDVLCHLYNKAESSIYKDVGRDKQLETIDEEAYKINFDSEYIHCTDELDKTLLSEIVEKRRRCLDTAKKIIEINSECDTMELKNKSEVDCKSALDVNSNKLKDGNANFFKMLISCKNYYNYLENQLPLLSVSVSSKILPMDADMNEISEKKINVGKISNKRKLSTNQQSNPKSKCSKTYSEYCKKILAKWNVDDANKEEKPKKAAKKPMFFTTLGKTSAKDKRLQREFFTDVRSLRKQRSTRRTSMSRNKPLSNVNCMSRTASYRRENLKPTVQVTNNQLSPRSIKASQKKVHKVNITRAASKVNITRAPSKVNITRAPSKVNITRAPSTKYSNKRNLSNIRKCGVDKNKENKVN